MTIINLDWKNAFQGFLITIIFRLQYKPKDKMWRANFTENEITIVGSKT
ncbi:hypothetical protein STFR1_10670 [Bacillus vallismortis]